MGIRTKEFYKLQNRVLEKLSKTDLSQNDNKYCWLLFRETFGYGNLKAKILGVRISDLTGILKTHVSRTERRLKERNIIIVNSKYKGFNTDISKWEKLPLPGLFEKLPLPVQKVTDRAEKKVTATGTLLTKKKENSKKGGVGLKKRTGKEIDKLEGKEWLRATMIELEGLPKEGTNEFLAMGNFMDCYNAWLALKDAYGIRNKISWLIAKIRRGPEPEE